MRHLGIVLAGLLCACSFAHGSVIFAYGPTTATRTDGGLVAGATFGTVGAATFNSLGFVDVGNDGLSGSYQVGIFDASQTLLASTTVTPSSQLISGFRYAPIPTVVIPAGQSFTVAALIPNSPADPWLEVDWTILSAGFFGGGTGSFTSSLSLAFPMTGDDVPYAVVNASPTAVPEPAAISLAVLSMGLAMRKRR